MNFEYKFDDDPFFLNTGIFGKYADRDFDFFLSMLYKIKLVFVLDGFDGTDIGRRKAFWSLHYKKKQFTANCLKTDQH